MCIIAECVELHIKYIHKVKAVAELFMTLMGFTHLVNVLEDSTNKNHCLLFKALKVT